MLKLNLQIILKLWHELRQILECLETCFTRNNSTTILKDSDHYV